MTTRPRAQRVAEEIKRTAAQILREMKDPRIGFVSVTDVEVSNDLSHVKIFVSVYGDEEAKQRTLEGLQAARGFVRTEIGRAIRMRHTPEILFRLDSSLEQGARINQLIAEISSAQGEREEAADTEDEQ